MELTTTGGEQNLSLSLTHIEEMKSFCELAVQSEMFKNLKSLAAAVMVVQIGREAGVPAAAALKGIHIIEGKPEFSPNLLSGMILRSGRGRIDIVKLNEKECVLQPVTYRGGKEIKEQEVSFTKEQADKIMIDAWENGPNGRRCVQKPLSSKGAWKNGYVEDMLYARALGRAARRYFPDVTMGPVYVQGEISNEKDILDVTGEAETAPRTEKPITAQKPEVIAAPMKRGAQNRAQGNVPPISDPANTRSYDEDADGAPTTVEAADKPNITPTDESSAEYEAWFLPRSFGSGKGGPLGDLTGNQIKSYLNNYGTKLSAEEKAAAKLLLEYKRAMSQMIKSRELEGEIEHPQTQKIVQAVKENFPGAVVTSVVKSQEQIYGDTVFPLETKKIKPGTMLKQIKDLDYLRAWINMNHHRPAVTPELKEAIYGWLNYQEELEELRKAELANDGIDEVDVDEPVEPE